MEINGFEIDKHNQYGFNERDKTSTCPICSANRKKSQDKCLTLHWDTGLGVCHHCGAVLQLHTYKSKKNVSVKEYKKPEWKNNTELSDNVVSFFERRGISQFTLRHMKISESREWMPQVKGETNTIQFNYFRDDELVNIKYRDANKNFKLTAGAELIFYNLDCIKYSETVIIVEGEMDALSYFECGIHNVVSVPNGSTLKNVNLEYLDNCIDYFENKTKIILALDNDEAGKNTTKEMIRRFGSHRCYLVDYLKYFKVKESGKENEHCKDANEVLVNHGKDALIKTIEEAKEVPLQGVYNIDNSIPEIIDLWSSGMPKGKNIIHRKLNNYITWITPALAIWTGIPSMGKSEVVDEIAVNLNIMHDWKVAYYSPENFPIRLHVSKIVSKITGKKFSKEQMPKYELEQALDYIKNNFFFMYQEEELTNASAEDMTIDRILEQARSLVLKKGIKQLVIDPISRISDTTDAKADTKTIGKLLNKLDRFAKMNDVLIHLVAHPTKMHKDKNTGDHEVPTLYDISGSANFYNSAFYGFTVHRDNEFTYIYVNKVKFKHLGEKGFVKFKYHFDSGRLVEVDENDRCDFSKIENFLLKPVDPDGFDLMDDVFMPTAHLEPKIETNDDIKANRNFYEIEKDEPPF